MDLLSELPCHRVRKILQYYRAYYGRHLAPRSKRRLATILELLDTYLAELGVTSVDFRVSAPHGAVRGVVSVDTLMLQLDGFDADYLRSALGGERELLRLAASVACDLTHWLHQHRIHTRGLALVMDITTRPRPPRGKARRR